MNTITGAVSRGLAMAIVALVVLLNIRAHRPGNVDTAIAQIRFLDRSLQEGAAERMQAVFPEGYVFTWALYGLASAQIARQLPPRDARRGEFLGRARATVGRLDAAVARSTFDAGLDPPYGAFYASWSLYSRAEYLRAAIGEALDPGFVRDFENDCARFAAALERSETPFLPSYSGSCWPADTAVGVAALGIHDRILPPRYQALIARWVAAAKVRSDPELGVLTFSAAAGSGTPIGGVRGSSLALISRVLVDASPEFARAHFTVLRERFVDYRWGVPGVREYSHGQEGTGDIDSGPLLLGYSGPAVVVGAAAARAHGDASLAQVLLGAVEVGGLPMEWGGRRRYMAGAIPVGDAFIAWAVSSPPPDRIVSPSWMQLLPWWWALPANLLSAIALCALGWRAVRSQ